MSETEEISNGNDDVKISEYNTNEEFCVLPCVGPATAEELHEEGYDSFKDIAKSTPMELHRSCDIVLSASTRVISSAVNQLPIVCPKCHHDDLGPIWQAKDSSIDYSDTESELFCNNCFWNGKISQAEISAES